jgi:hypothetical protein
MLSDAHNSVSPASPATEASFCPADASCPSHPNAACDDQFSRVTLSLCRFIGAAYATGAADCWEAAYRFADETPGIPDGALLVARAASLVRAIRSCRKCAFVFMPPSCKRLSRDEVQLMKLLAIARGGTPGELEPVVSCLVGVEDEHATTRAVHALAFCQRATAA